MRFKLLALVLVVQGCSSAYDKQLASMVLSGEHGAARERMLDRMTANKDSRNYLLDRMRLGTVALADGVETGTEETLQEVYDTLRTQGINDDRTVGTLLISDRVRFWKGEPFEQAMALHYVSVWYASQGIWGNARAAADESLFRLMDFGGNPTAEDLIKAEESEEGYLDSAYQPVDSDFALGYLLSGIANEQIGDDEAAEDKLDAVRRLRSDLLPVVETIEEGSYNTILVVDYGSGPQKYARGPDNAIADFRPTMESDGHRLYVDVDGSTEYFPIACDLNMMAADHKWKGVEDVRIAKSHIGSVLLGVGTGVAYYGAASNDSDVALVGLGMMLAGAISKASAHANTDYCEVMPQRVYVAPVMLPADGTVTVGIEGYDDARMVLKGLDGPRRGDARLRYVRLVSKTPAAPTWAVSRDLHYCNDRTPDVAAVHLPYVLGGTCCCTPSDEMLASCRRAGLLEDMSLSDLRELYRAEGIMIEGEEPGVPGRHVLEGGKWLYTPMVGTAGFNRLFGYEHRAYRPRSAEMRMAASEVQSNLAMASQ